MNQESMLKIIREKETTSTLKEKLGNKYSTNRCRAWLSGNGKLNDEVINELSILYGLEK
jgi:hypothetical protein